MSSHEKHRRVATAKWDNPLLATRPQVSAKALTWTFVKSVVFSALVCLVVLGMAELVTR